MKQVEWVDPPHGFTPKSSDGKPWKNGTRFIIDGLLWEVYEMKRAKPLARALIRLEKVAMAVDAPSDTLEKTVPVTEQVTPRQEFEDESYTPPTESADRPK